MKKILATVLLMVLMTRAFAYNFSAVCETGQTLYYRILSGDNNEVAVTHPCNNPIGWNGFAKPEGSLIIPEFVEHGGITYNVVALDQCALDGCQGITSVELPNTIRRIGVEAFWYCSGISNELVIPDQCTFIGGYAFCGCSAISALTIGASVDTIQFSAFEDCTSLQSIYCNTPTPPFAQHIPSNPAEGYEDRSIFNNVPTDIPVFVSCLTIDQFQSSQDWSRFSNLEGVFVGAPLLIVDVNSPEYGTVDVVSVPEDCGHLTATVRATPNQGHSFGYWKSGTTVVSFDQEYTFTLKHNTSLTACFDCSAIINEELALPDHIIGRIFNDAGQVTNEYPSDFIYSDDGVLTDFSFPGTVSTQYHFASYPSRPSYFFSMFGGHPSMTERYDFSYNNYDKIENTNIVRSGAGDEYTAHISYYYDEEMRLIGKDFYYNDYMYYDGYTQKHYYAYSNDNRTRTDSIAYYTDEGQLYRWSLTTNHYNQRLQPLTVQTETINSAGNPFAHTLKTYSYTLNNKTDNIITQTLSDGVWANTSIIHYVYDDGNRVIEYQTGSWSAENEDWDITNKVLYDYNDEEQKLVISFQQKSGDEWARGYYSDQPLLFDSVLYEWQRAMTNYQGYDINQFEIDLHYVTKEIVFPRQSEWYYEIEWESGDITYQHLEYVADTTIGTSRPKVIVRSNTQYDKDGYTEVTHEYILEEGNRVYWWNKDLEEYTTLYDYNAETGDEWEIKVGTESIIVHVDSVGIFEYEGEARKMMHISDAGNVFNGDIVVGYGHMTSFFPERLMNRSSGFNVNGLRCYWLEDALLYHNGEEDCDAVYSELHNVVENGGNNLNVYPNPANNVLIIETQGIVSATYRITNVMGQILLQGIIVDETQQIDITKLTAGMYFITVDNKTVKFVKR